MIQERKLNIIKSIESARKSKLLVYVHNDAMSYKHIPVIYSKLKELGNVQNLDIFIHSDGGEPQTAYKIVKMCREYCKGKLSVIVPLKAKGTATLLTLGVDEIVMGPSSELGPIDPQIFDKGTNNWGYTQHLNDSIDFIEQRMGASDNPQKTSYLLPIIDKLHPFFIGEKERIEKNSIHYAKLLLKKGMLAKSSGFILDNVIKKLCGSYYPHGYAIDHYVAKKELYLKVVNCTENEWQDIWNLFILYNEELESNRQKLSFVETAFSIHHELSGSNDYEIYDENDIQLLDDFEDDLINANDDEHIDLMDDEEIELMDDEIIVLMEDEVIEVIDDQIDDENE